jgi:hypothetical protein
MKERLLLGLLLAPSIGLSSVLHYYNSKYNNNEIYIDYKTVYLCLSSV